MRHRAAILGVWLWLVVPGLVTQASAGEVQLHIPPLFQERPDWCWAAVGEMVFKYYEVPAAHPNDYQCGIVHSRHLCKEHSNCLDCELPAADDTGMVTLLEQYPATAMPAGSGGAIRLTARSKTGRLSEAEVKQELDANRPIIVGLSPSGFKVEGATQHMALIVGYTEGSDHLTLIVNDPFPFEDDRFLWIGNPYVAVHASGPPEAEYEIGYDRFRGRLKWTQTIYGITCTGQGCPPDPPTTATVPDSKDDRDVLRSVLSASTEDFHTLRTGHKAVDAVQGTTWRSRASFSGAKQCLVRDKDDHRSARWHCTFTFDDREDAENAVRNIVNRLHQNLPEGWAGTDLDEDTESDLDVTTDKFSARKPGTPARLRLYMTNIKKTGRVTIYLSVENNQESS
ncbi:MAG TPA: papain-like cysteine protease family protein [Nitrospira sp.]|nr:papain-like cysteine protease family protein [Nitrospira sp.]